MKPAFFLTLAAGLASSVVEASDRILKQARRPQPSSEFMTYAHPSLKLDKSNLQELPGSVVDAPVSTLSSRQPSTGDFYECRQSNPAPSDSDCNRIIDEVFALDTPLIIAPNACLLFQFGTCWGFFCSLCEQLSTDTDFVANQLISTEALCVAGGQSGTIVGTDAPEWEAGFIYQGGSLPTYDVC
ncbi:hypothetical protein F4820DRAFT_69499 [Hypoxylon rubiginosum]|uniref:Uncharacterized protein n=1 Tax=Hypoxylon rubiginosum TaxID=110542 RepID=A0ACB9YPW9_9PEZI|nr:hypothetical protein F4820DRAFT_69499 [Hypoxylon rubiginosum]